MLVLSDRYESRWSLIRNDGQNQMGWMITILVDFLTSFHEDIIGPKGVTGIRVSVKAGKVAATHLKTYPVSR